MTHWRLEEWIREEGAESLQTALPRGGIDTHFRTGTIHEIEIASTRPACWHPAKRPCYELPQL